jgi:hypothetical protein
MVARDHHLGSLADDIAAQADPCPPDQLQSKTDRFADGARHVLWQARRFQDHEQATRPSGQCREAMQPIRDARWAFALRPAPGRRPARFLAEPRRQIDEQQVHRPTLQQRPGDAQPLIQRLRRQDDEPLPADAARDGLTGIKRAREVQVRDDRATHLCLCREPQRERGLATGRVTVCLLTHLTLPTKA